MAIHFSPSLRGFFDSNVHQTIPSDAVEISAAEHAELLTAQSLGKTIVANLDGVPSAVDAPARTPEQMWSRIQSERDRRKAAGYLVAGKWFHSDADSRIQQLGLVMLGESIPEGLKWKTMDGTFVDMTPALAQAVFAAAAASDIATFAAAEAHKAAMEAAEVPGEYDFSAGWPSVFGE